MDSKVKFLRGTAAEYTASTKDNDVFYYTTDTKKLYLGVNEIGNKDADTVDGKHADEFYPAKAVNIQGGDYDTVVNNGIYEIQGSATTPSTNAPNGNNSSNNFYVQVFRHSRNWLTQIATSVRGDRKQYIRSKENGVWNEWQRISAGDAETLGGKSVSDFLPASGGTVSGELYLKDSRYVHGLITDGTHGGFYDCAEITVNTAWANHSVVFTMSNRGNRPITVVLMFANVATTDPEIASLIYYGGSIYNNKVICYKTGTSTWRLAVYMHDKNDKWTIHDYYRGESKNMISITWMSDYLSATIPDGATVATLGGYIQNAERLNTARAIDGISFDGTADISHYAICSTPAATAAKTVALTGFALKVGARVAVKFTVTNTATSPTLNVNNTGAKAIYYRGAAISAGYLAANRTYEFVYNGTQYELVGDLDTNTDTKVTQNNSTANAAYRVLLSPNANDTAETNTVVKSANFIANPSTGAFYAAGYDRVDITMQTLDLDTLTLSSGHPLSAFYICRSSGGANNITNLPTAAMAFLLNVELIRWVSSADYLTIQTLISFADPSVQHFRYCKNGTWTGWEKRINHDEQWLDVCDIDSSDCENLKYIDSTGAVISSQEYAVSGYIPINNNDIVYGAANNVDAGIPCIALYDASKTFITSLSCQNVRSHGSWRIAINNLTARYMRVNYYGTSTTSTASAKSLLPPSQQFLIIRRNANENSDIKITVDGTASTENMFTYKTFFKGLQVAYAIGNCYLDVKPSSSDYNIGTEMGGAFYSWGTFSTISSTVAYGGWIGHNITVEFEQGAKVIATNSNSKNVGQMFSILNVSDSFKLINANLEVTNCRYCVHEDRWILGDIPSYYTAEYINCIMKNNGATSAIGWHASCCIGAGTTKGSNSIIRGGYYESPSAFPYPISYHNSTSSASKDEKVTIENVILASGNKLRMHNLYKTGSIVNVYLIGNYTTSPIFVEATDGISDRFVVHGDGDGKVPIYSVNEFLTGEIWINGKPIYGKYYETNFGSDTAAWTVGTISGFDEIIDVRGWGVFGSAAGNISYWGEHYTTDTKGTNSLYFQVNSKGNIVCTSLNPYNYSTNNDAKVRVIIKYTKT